MKKIVLTGGGSAGHVTPNLALVPRLLEHHYTIDYIGSYNGIEKNIMEDTEVTYHSIASGKLRRYFSWKNFTDPFKVLFGTLQAFFKLGKIKPSLVFSKGGFVTVPVIIAAKLRGIPVISHESDMTPGLANKISMPFAKKVCTTFEDTLSHLPSDKGVYTGSPIRESIYTGNAKKGYDYTGLNNQKPVVMIMGGSLGAKAINQSVRDALDTLLLDYQIIHLCGSNNIEETLSNKAGYKQYEYVKSQLPDLFAITDLMVSRSGANALSEILALKLPNILIPLSAAASRGDQILNADAFVKRGYSYVLTEENMTKDTLIDAIKWATEHSSEMVESMNASSSKNGIDNIVNLINHYAK